MAGIAFVVQTALEKEDIGLDALRVKNARGQAQHCMQVALVHKLGTDALAVAIGKQHVVRQDNSGPSAGLQTAVNMLQEIELLVAGGKGKVITGSPFPALLGAEWRIGQHKVIASHVLSQGGKGVAQGYLAFNAVQHGIHQSQTMGIVYQFTAAEGRIFLKSRHILGQLEIIIGPRPYIPICGYHKTKGAAGRVITAFTGLGAHEPSHDINKPPRRKILPCAGLLFIGVLFQQTFIQVASPSS